MQQKYHRSLQEMDCSLDVPWMRSLACWRFGRATAWREEKEGDWAFGNALLVWRLVLAHAEVSRARLFEQLRAFRMRFMRIAARLSGLAGYWGLNHGGASVGMTFHVLRALCDKVMACLREHVNL